MVVFGMAIVILSRNAVVNSFYYNQSLCVDETSVLNVLATLVPCMLMPLIIMVLLSAHEKAYNIHSFLWYSYCSLCTFMLITGTFNVIEYIYYGNLTRDWCIKTEVTANFFVSILANMGKNINADYIACTFGTVTLAICFICKMFWANATLPKRILMGLSLISYLIISICIMVFVCLQYLSWLYVASDCFVGTICALLSFACFLVDKHLVKKMKNQRNQNEVLSDEKYEVLNLNMTDDAKDCEENTPCNQ